MRDYGEGTFALETHGPLPFTLFAGVASEGVKPNGFTLLAAPLDRGHEGTAN